MFKVKQSFKFAHRGVEVVEYEAGAEHDFVDADLIKVATEEKWIEPAKATKASKAAPENKGE